MQSADPFTFVAAFAIAQFWLAPILALAISGVYFFTSPATQTLYRRLVASLHGAVIAALYLGALMFNAVGISKPEYGIPFLATLLLPVVLIATSFILYEGKRSLHALQMVNLLCIAWTFFIGGMAITGEWL